MINLFQPQVGDAELAAVAEVFERRWLGHGPRTTAFEDEFAEHLGVPPDRVLFLNSGTASLFVGLDLLDLGPGDEVVLPSVAFIAAANAVVSAGARPVFCDVDPRTLNPTLADVERAVTPATKAVVVLHYGGYPGDVVAIAEFCAERGIDLLEDAACSPASRVDGRAAGSFGDLAIWSFDAAKVMVTGDGGMLYVRDADRAERARRLVYHGLRHASGLGRARTAGQWWKLDVEEVGRRVIGNDLTAAIGSVQLRKLPAMVARRREIVELYDRELADVAGLALPPPLPAGHESSYYFYWVQMDPAIRDDVASDLFAEGVYTTFRYEPLHRVPLYGAVDAELPGTEWLAGRTLCLPLHPGLSDEDVRVVADRLRKAVESRPGRADR
ncbi:aminotransferase [Saccharothrix carnea]|uniref:Aminotransferase n=1 Tax=Saccharothrix carnea TaxID=1280637 RepID=A0A2P8I2H9_SACCR|nr:DegT/DnrJ/EryC1/StrS family aminotransferase [Saccharothrix carnea]PSL52672.1 aminotransferase [Saccharothrix carnea]